MPSYLAPGVYTEEVNLRDRSLEGVSTSVAALVGPTRYGPTAGEPELLTSYADFDRIYGGLDAVQFVGDKSPTLNYVAHAARAFFDNGGQQLYVVRVYEPTDAAARPPDPNTGKSSLTISGGAVTLRARFPGQDGQIRVAFAARTTPNLLQAILQPGASGAPVQANDVVYITENLLPAPANSPSIEGLYDVFVDPVRGISFRGLAGSTVAAADLNTVAFGVHRVTIGVRTLRPDMFAAEENWGDFAADMSDPTDPTTLIGYFKAQPASRQLHLTVPFQIETGVASGALLAQALLGPSVLGALHRGLMTQDTLRARPIISPARARPQPRELEQSYTLTGGDDGLLPTAEFYQGNDDGTLKTGLTSLVDIEEVSMVAVPGATKKTNDIPGSTLRALSIIQNVIIHCEQMRYRVAILDSMDNQLVSEVRDFRGQFSTEYAALYYPWVRILDPTDPAGKREILLPPSGYVAGIYARTDIRRGVFKAPANEAVLGAIGFEFLINKAQQEILNPDSINCLRFLSGRGYLVYGARTITDNSDFKYISVRRYFNYLEHTLDRGMQFAVFEVNSDQLWADLKREVEEFLISEWRSGALLGATPDQAFFVRCDRSVMTQNDIDNGRLVCLIGVAVVKPAEFVIFRLGQFTAGS